MGELKRNGGRVEALDLLRGLAVAGMIIVVSPGDWATSYAPLQHAAWNGWTPADLVFPTFLFCVGMAWALSFPRREADLPTLWPRILRRTALLILIGLFLNALPDFGLAHLRIPGILQRIALCYLITAALTLWTARRRDGMLQMNAGAIAIAAVVLLLSYWAMLRFVPVPGFGAGRLDSFGTLPAWIDRNVFTTDHLWKYGTTEGVGVTYDPEGILSTLGAVGNSLIGVLAAVAVRRLPQRRSAVVFAIAGAALIGIAYFINPVLPINKRIWTSSFTLASSGVSLLVLSALLLLPASRIVAAITWPLRVLGANAILAFVLSQLLGVIGGLTFVPSGQGTVSPQQWGNSVANRLVPDPYLASLACAIGILLLIVLAITPMHRRGVHLRV
jgi:predicted acyltransferase